MQKGISGKQFNLGGRLEIGGKKIVIKGEKTTAKKGVTSMDSVLGCTFRGKGVAQGVLIVVLLPQLMQQKSTCSSGNNGTKLTRARAGETGSEWPKASMRGQAVSSSASGFKPGWALFCTSSQGEQRAEGEAEPPPPGQSQQEPRHRGSRWGASASQAGVHSSANTPLSVRLTDSDSNRGTTAHQRGLSEWGCAVN